MGIDFKAEEEFPPDDTGYGFDNIGDVLTVSPLLLEKYFQAAETIVKTAVPTASRSSPRSGAIGASSSAARRSRPERRPAGLLQGRDGLAVARRRGRRRLSACCSSWRCRAPTSSTRAVHGRLQGRRSRAAARDLYRAGQQDVPLHRSTSIWPPGDHKLDLRAQAAESPKAAGAVDLRIVSVRVQGPMDAAHRRQAARLRAVLPPGRAAGVRSRAPAIRPRGARPVRRAGLPAPGRRPDARSPGDDRRVGLPPARARPSRKASRRPWWPSWPRPASCSASRTPSPASRRRPHAPIDEYALASRLSYFLWSTMPDDELFGLAEQGRLRAELPRRSSGCWPTRAARR